MNRFIPHIFTAVAVLLTNVTWGQVQVTQIQDVAQAIQGQFSAQPDQFGTQFSAQAGQFGAQVGQFGTQIGQFGAQFGAQVQNPDHASGFRTELRTETQTYQVYNPATGQYETRTRDVIVPVQVPIGGGGQGVQPGTFLATIVNNRNEVLTVSVDSQQRQLNPGQSWQVRASDGQVFSYHGPGRTIQRADGTAASVGGALASAQFSSNQTTYNIGGGGGGGAGGGGPVPVPGGTFQATFVNNGSDWVKVSVDGQQRQLNPGQQWQVNATEGKTYSLVLGPPKYTTHPDGSVSAVGGGVAAGTFSASQKVISLGGGGAGGGQNQGAAFLVTFVNNGSGAIYVGANGEERLLGAGQSWQVNAREGQRYSVTPPPSFTTHPNGTVTGVGGGGSVGTFSASRRTINVGGPGGGTANTNTFLVTVVNGFQNGVTVNVGGQSRKLGSGQSWQVSAKEGQQYSVAGDPRQTAQGVWVGGGTHVGTFTSNQNVVNLGGGNAGGGGGNAGGGPVPVNPGGGPNPLTGSFQVTFTNNASGPVTLTLRDTQQNVLATRTLQVGQGFSSTAKFGYTYHQDGPNITTAFGSTSGSASGGISPSNPNISLTDPR